MQGADAMKGANVMNIQRCEKGAALIVAMVLMAVLAAFAAAIIREGSTRMRTVEVAAQGSQSLLLAEAAMADACRNLGSAGPLDIGTLEWTDQPDENGYLNGLADWCEVKDLADGPVPFDFGHYEGHYWTQVVTLRSPNATTGDAGYKRVIAYGRVGPPEGDRARYPVARCDMIVEGAYPEEVHEAFSGKYGVYTGGGDGYKLIFKGQVGGKADRIEGDVYVDGDVSCQAASQVIGDLYATGEVSGKPPDRNNDGTPDEDAKHSYSPKILPPDFTKLKDLCDINVGTSFGTTWTRPWNQCASSGISGYEQPNIVDTGVLTVPADNPAHIFAKDSFTPEAMGGVETSVDNYQLGDWVSSDDGETIRVYDSGNHKSYYVPGNLWIDPQGYGPTFHLTDPSSDEPDGVQITIVVEGNVYVGDEMYYSNPALDAVAIIAVQARDALGEPIERPEGSGNIFFGDLNANTRPLQVNAMLMAENKFLDKVLDDGEPVEFTLNGLMACGGQLDLIDRGQYANYAPMTVRHDPRLELPVDQGGIRLPNLPTSSKIDNTRPPEWHTVVRWRSR